MAKKSNIDKRRRIRALEAKRDVLLDSQVKTKSQLAQVRAQLSAERKA